MSIKIPIFEEILLNEMSAEKLRIIISDSRIGKVPCYLNLAGLEKEEMDSLILNLEQILLDHNLHPLFPYPFYIISKNQIKSIIPWAKTVKDLPDHFFKKIKRPNNKELQLLNKINLKMDKIKNLELYKTINQFKNTSLSQKELYNITKELYFLEVLNSKFYEKPKKK